MATAANREQVSAIIVGYPKILANSEPPNRLSPEKCGAFDRSMQHHLM
jgi:hypothetical protein